MTVPYSLPTLQTECQPYDLFLTTRYLPSTRTQPSPPIVFPAHTSHRLASPRLRSPPLLPQNANDMIMMKIVNTTSPNVAVSVFGSVALPLDFKHTQGKQVGTQT